MSVSATPEGPNPDRRQIERLAGRFTIYIEYLAPQASGEQRTAIPRFNDRFEIAITPSEAFIDHVIGVLEQQRERARTSKTPPHDGGPHEA